MTFRTKKDCLLYTSFIAVGAMCEFTPLIRAPYVMLFAAAAHFGIFAAALLAAMVGFPFNEAA